MPRMTAKYSAALAALRKLRKPTTGDQEAAYKRLMDAGYMWDSKTQVWLNLGNEPADKPTQMIRVRVWTDASKVDDAANVVVAAMQDRFHLVERSDPYPCRPPKQAESRVYLSFLRMP